MTTTAWFNCCAGVAGDMLLASLIDAGADRMAVTDAWAALGVGGYAATWERVQRCGVAALWTNLVRRFSRVFLPSSIHPRSRWSLLRRRLLPDAAPRWLRSSPMRAAVHLPCASMSTGSGRNTSAEAS